MVVRINCLSKFYGSQKALNEVSDIESTCEKGGGMNVLYINVEGIEADL
jgi:hypothetical protein